MSRKIYYLHTLAAGPLRNWPSHFERVRTMGFDTVCVTPPFAPAPGCDIFTTFDRNVLHPRLGWNDSAVAGLEWAAAAARACGLALWLDLPLDRIAASAAVCRRHPDWFNHDAGAGLPDPRRPPQPIGLARPRFEQSEAAEGLTHWWQEQLGPLLRAGVAGFRCLDPDAVPAWIWQRLIERLRAERADAAWLAWMPQPPRAGVPGLAEAGFDQVGIAAAPAELPAQASALRPIAPVIAAPEGCFQHRLAAALPPDADLPAAYRHALAVAAAAGNGLLVPMGFELAARRRFDPERAGPADWEAVQDEAPADLAPAVAAAAELVDRLAGTDGGGTTRLLTPDGPVAAWLRLDAPDPRHAETATLVLANHDLARPGRPPLPLVPLPPAAGAAWTPAQALNGEALPLEPGELRLIDYRRTRPLAWPDRVLPVRPDDARHGRIAIEAVTPAVPDLDAPAKALVGQAVTVEADIFADGHDRLAADLLWRPAEAGPWQRVPMRPIGNDRWRATIRPDRVGRHDFTIEAWWDAWDSFSHDLAAKHAAGQDLALERQEGRDLLTAALDRADPAARACIAAALRRLDGADAVAGLLDPDLAAAMRAADDRPFATRPADLGAVQVDRPQAAFASWYELFPRSVTDDPARHGTLRDVIRRLPAIRDMGFDVLYFPPIHPIGQVNRKGRNNALRAAPGDVGSPYAIGSEAGGHDAIHPALGTLADFRALVAAAADHGLELALDFAVQCAPDHPWLKQHRDWFRWRPDGSLRYAENPPKKYEDIVNPDFYAAAAMPDLWLALRDAVQFWVDQGVRIFRVDNPHTKPLPFWRWLIADIQTRNPDVLFLAEAFTRPKLMYRLAKLGFSQSYTYFTWRNTKAELTEYLTELNTPPVSDFFRPNFFVNTPDINPIPLQTSGRPGFLIRAALAATLSGLWGVYSGFEHCEAAPLPGREEYLDSEKYEIRPRDIRSPGDLVDEIAALNRIRRGHPALQSHLGVTFHPAHDDQVLLYGKRAPDTTDIVLVAVNLDPHTERACTIEVPLWQFGLPDDGALAVRDLVAGTDFTWSGKYQQIRLDPAVLPYAIWRLRPAGGQA